MNRDFPAKTSRMDFIPTDFTSKELFRCCRTNSLQSREHILQLGSLSRYDQGGPANACSEKKSGSGTEDTANDRSITNVAASLISSYHNGHRYLLLITIALQSNASKKAAGARAFTAAAPLIPNDLSSDVTTSAFVDAIR